MSGSNKGPLRPLPLEGLADIMGEMSQVEMVPSGARAPRGSSLNFDWLVELFKKYTIPMMKVYERLSQEGFGCCIIRQKLVRAWLLRKDGTEYTAAELVDFIFNDKVFFSGQRVKMLMGPSCTLYGIIPKVDWHKKNLHGAIFSRNERLLGVCPEFSKKYEEFQNFQKNENFQNQYFQNLEFPKSGIFKIWNFQTPVFFKF